MITVIGGTKGGSGKSTVSTNLAVMLANSGRETLLIDADDQETAQDFTNLRNEQQENGAGYTCISLTGKAVYTETKRLAEKHQEVIIDCGGRDTASQRAALTICDTYLVPFVPRSFDVWTLDKVVELIEEVQAVNPNFKSYAFLNRADTRGTDNADAAEFLQDTEILQFLDAPLAHRKAFANAASQGLSVVELRPQDKKASDEIGKLFRYLFDIQKISNITQAGA